MAESDKPHDGTPLVADDMIGSLAARVRELSLRVAQLEGELEAARRRIAVYEDFDSQVQDSLSAALRAANQVRERARVTAEAIAEEARAQRPGSATELDALRIERDALRRAIDDALAGVARTPAAAPAAATYPMSEMRSAAADALRGVFKELVAEIRATTPPAATPTPAPAAASPRPDNSPPSFASSSVSETPAVQRPVAPTPPPAATVSAPAPQPAYAPPVSAPLEQEPAPQPHAAPAPSFDRPEGPPQPMPRPTLVPPSPPPAPQPSAVVEDEEIAPATSTQPAAPAPAPEPAAAEPAREQWVAAPSEPIGEVQVVLSPISSFPRLVELERRLQGIPVVRTVYARDFRNGVATLAIGLRHPMTVDEFAAAVTKLDYPRLRIVSTSGYVLELRIDTEASSIA